jgi:hypothetical protein
MSLTEPLTVTEESSVTKPAVGDVIVSRGGVVSRVTWTLLDPTSPAASAATAVSTLLPSISGTETLNAPLLIGAPIPFTLTATAEALTVPFTVVGLWFKKVRFVGVVIDIEGGAFTVRVAVPETPDAAVIVVVPFPTPVASPPALMVATASFEDVHVTVEVMSRVLESANVPVA